MDKNIVGVVGMGYVGIPSAVLLADNIKYSKVYGFQRNSKSSGYKINMLNNGENPLIGNEPELSELLKSVVERKKFECTSDFSKLSECDAITISIQTPFLNNIDLIPDQSALESGLITVGKYMSKNKKVLVVLESTVTPGTTVGYAKNILERESGMIAGKDFCLAHAPERVMVGHLIENIRNHDRIVGGIDVTSTLAAAILYSPILKKGKIIPMSATAAEVTKTAENTFRDLQIAASNQLALYCESIGINFYDVKKGIDSLKGEGITRAMLFPGAGVGGHCLTKDTYHLERGAHKYHIDYPMHTPSLYVVARKVNDFMPIHMFNLTIDAIRRVDIPNPKIVVLGWSFLPDTSDARNSPSESYVSHLIKNGFEYQIHDPYIYGMNDDFFDVVFDVDVVAIFTAHSQYKRLLEDPIKIKNSMNRDHPIIVDGRNMIDPDDFIKCGFIYKGIGRGDKNNHSIC
jgi:UDP-N-acetyl-D-mannosaminuronic acid dehydrogenase